MGAISNNVQSKLAEMRTDANTVKSAVHGEDVRDAIKESINDAADCIEEAIENELTSLDSVLVLGYGDSVVIPAGSDLNTYTTPGNYRVNQVYHDEDIISNMPPTTNPGRLIVMNLHRAPSIIQFYIVQVASSFDKIYYRSSVEAGSWSDWLRIATMQDLPLADEGESWGS